MTEVTYNCIHAEVISADASSQFSPQTCWIEGWMGSRAGTGLNGKQKPHTPAGK
jgi:hypothetical protein